MKIFYQENYKRLGEGFKADLNKWEINIFIASGIQYHEIYIISQIY